MLKILEFKTQIEQCVRQKRQKNHASAILVIFGTIQISNYTKMFNNHEFLDTCIKTSMHKKIVK